METVSRQTVATVPSSTQRCAAHYQYFTLPVLHTTSSAHRHRQQQLLLVLTDSFSAAVFQLFCLELCFYFAAFSLASRSSFPLCCLTAGRPANITFWILSTISSALCFPSFDLCSWNSPGIPRLGTIKKFTYVLLVPHLPLIFAFHRLISAPNNPSVALPSSTAGTPAAPPKTGSFGNFS